MLSQRSWHCCANYSAHSSHMKKHSQTKGDNDDDEKLQFWWRHVFYLFYYSLLQGLYCRFRSCSKMKCWLVESQRKLEQYGKPAVVESGGWTVFNQIELLFVIGYLWDWRKMRLGPLESFVVYTTFNNSTRNSSADVDYPMLTSPKEVGTVGWNDRRY